MNAYGVIVNWNDGRHLWKYLVNHHSPSQAVEKVFCYERIHIDEDALEALNEGEDVLDISCRVVVVKLAENIEYEELNADTDLKYWENAKRT